LSDPDKAGVHAGLKANQFITSRVSRNTEAVLSGCTGRNGVPSLNSDRPRGRVVEGGDNVDQLRAEGTTMRVDKPNVRNRIMISQEDIEKYFRILEYLLFKLTFFTLAAIGAYHLIVHA
jgi:hypothetical protein